ncbi:polysaccharide pyruvyl transferase family protein [Zobellia galactanivorans]|uniref:polysaccharide pyruvyl transferase family protein n=1 Tax=Zobellia galactanivorans (strain DSM 12802 / CCUG 47099 / CIP 106680 / NCIMB 13871 / Dsij) TaxID=63186 RepID=UPI0026E323DD|nr:polysaccharide pyruvyl transferase family protein [Zobellia galactanivorans]MDO6810412.1 polysaccharide pyruvyl transferase family protein [Zobellia galactanivorans]
MRIGQLTLPFNWNYGGLLQGYALNKTLTGLGNDVILISRRQNRDNPVVRTVAWFKWELFKKLRHIPLFHVVPLICVEGFKRKYIKNITPDIFSESELKKVQSKYNLKGFVVGSDQIWNYNAAPHITNAFLDFVSDGPGVKRVSYAPSFGKDTWQYPEDATIKCKSLVKKFDAVSAREQSGVQLCKQYLEVEAEHHLDPTMLLSKEDYINIINESKVAQSNGKLLSYILDFSDENQKIINEVKSVLNLEPYAVKQENKITLLKNAMKGIYPSVAQWLKSFHDAEFVVTDSFHGTIFSIIFNKPFLAIGNRKRGLARFNSLLKMFELEGRLVSGFDDVSKANILSPIDWSIVNQKIEIEKVKGIEYLGKHLK